MWFERVILVSVLGCSAFATLPAYSQIQVGLTQVDITPPPGGLTMGYSSAKPTDEVHDAVTATLGQATFPTWFPRHAADTVPATQPGLRSVAASG